MRLPEEGSEKKKKRENKLVGTKVDLEKPVWPVHPPDWRWRWSGLEALGIEK